MISIFRGQPKFQANPESYNGAVRENYSWSQDYMDVEVRVFVSKSVLKGRQVNTHTLTQRRFHHRLRYLQLGFTAASLSPGCAQVSVSMQPSSIKVCARDGAEEKTLMEGEFTHKINTENSLWSLEPGHCVVVSTRQRHTRKVQDSPFMDLHGLCFLAAFVSQLSLCKTSEVWWNAVLKGEEEIDVNKINRERSMATVDDEEHAVLDRLTFDYHRKLQGKPQSHEMVRSQPGLAIHLNRVNH